MQVGTKVEWDWGQGTGEGKIVERHERRVQRKIEGSTITRNGESGNAALVIETDDGKKVLKLESEVRKA